MNPHQLHSSSFLFVITSFMFIIGISTSPSLNDGGQRFDPCSHHFECGSIQNLSYPFWWVPNHSPDCAPPGFEVKCQDKTNPVIEIHSEAYHLLSVDQEKKILKVVRMDIWKDACPHKLVNTSLDDTPFDYAPNYQNLTFLYKCSPRDLGPGFKGLNCSINDEEGFYEEVTRNVEIQSCEVIVAVPVLPWSLEDLHRGLGIQEVMRKGFELNYKYDDGQACSSCVKSNPGKNKLSLILPIVISGTVGILIICLLIFFCRKKWKSASSNLVSRNISSVPSSKSDLERGSVYFGVLPIFSYSELEEATNNFDPTKELGDGGFGIVYYGKLRDGREVAVKRLYENSCKRVEQFMNEVQILAVLRHKNLVSLYGCTSRHSRELLLVYEFIPNGTVADHLHGDQPKPGSLTWPIRMSIAIETATALAYLHASDIIHRDVKTNNILLDNNFCVKVADFGLSRLFPIDVTHVSTAPQGTPGYVDPEYHQCYQLTDKSDVYSFGVVLIELISSLPAVDISRHRHEINLGELAITKIQNCAFSELIDSSLGFESDLMVRRMTTKVAELAFRCLQHDKDMRPSMDEVCDILKEIESEEYEVKKTEEVENIDVGVLEKNTRSLPSPDSDDIGLLKNMQLPPHSPNTVTEKWDSRYTTPNTSA